MVWLVFVVRKCSGIMPQFIVLELVCFNKLITCIKLERMDGL